MGKIVRYITTDGSAFVVACDSTDMIAEAERIHKPSAPVTAGIGRLLTAASMMGVMLKGKDDVVIAKDLGIAHATVQGHIRQIYRKSDAQSFRELMTICRMCIKN